MGSHRDGLFHGHFGVELDRHRVVANGLDSGSNGDAALVQIGTSSVNDCGSDIGRRDRTEQATGVTSIGTQDNFDSAQLCLDVVGVIEVANLAS